MTEHATHAGRMDAKYRRVRHTYDLTRRYFLFGRERALDLVCDAPGGSVLEVGCGTGRNLAAIAARRPDLDLYGIDISSEMLDTARRRLAGRPPALARGDARALDLPGLLGIPWADTVLMSYSLSMVPQWRTALASVMGCVAPGGRLVIVDFGRFGAWGAAGRWMVRELGRHQAPPLVALERELPLIAASKGLVLETHVEGLGGWYQLAVAKRPA